ncbi:MAG: hypothetical protein LBU90_09170 [Bacteroidales bacterium]|jgi:hypothetical protein|nr:hypothetical protein [Bacteroidales bacterium]
MKTLKTQHNTIQKSEFFKTVLDDKRQIREYLSKFGSLQGFKSKNFEFAKPL